ncbi:MAG: sigma-54 dependent transcriptional regulator [Bacteroidetes bacterium]|nr:sigma-54 dependent transcriptional regulator [Bacteroidota bacterium]MCL2329230.1 sigma-54 dependent transcriptional regulator [Bacteroidota bacterium]
MKINIQQIKQRFGIIGNSLPLNRAIETAIQIAPTDLSVLIVGESGTGKEVFSQIIHQNSARKHHQYIAINCGAIPDGTIDSELFGHEKGAFTGAIDSRKGYFELADGGTIFLDEVGELPLSTQVRLLRVLEVGEYIRVGSSKIQKTNVRIIAATNSNLQKAIDAGKFREDLYYRLNRVPISILPLRERREDIPLLFRKFSTDICEKHGIPLLRLDDAANELLKNYYWKGNIRQLKNIAEQISILESERNISAQTLAAYLPQTNQNQALAIIAKDNSNANYANERDSLFQLLFDLKKDMSELKKLVFDILNSSESELQLSNENAQMLQKIYTTDLAYYDKQKQKQEEELIEYETVNNSISQIEDAQEIEENTLLLANNEMDIIKRALVKYSGKRKLAAKELGISERTLYRKIKEYNL